MYPKLPRKQKKEFKRQVGDKNYFMIQLINELLVEEGKSQDWKIRTKKERSTGWL